MAALNVFVEVSIIIIIATVVSAIAKLLRQPLIIGYIITGILVSPFFLGIEKATTTITAFSQLGIVLLLFIVGLNLNPMAAKRVGFVSLVAGFGQVFLTAFLGFFISVFLGFSVTVSFYISIALAFSSTIIVTKLLSDKGDLETLYGRISIGILLVQDLVAIFVLMIIPSLSGHVVFATIAGSMIAKGIGILSILFVVSYYLLPKIDRFVAKSQEFLFMFSISWCLAWASIFQILGFSIEIGALLSGISLSISPYRYEISSKLRPLRDFFIIIFFILLGSQMEFASIGDYIVPAIAISLFVLVGKPVIVMALMGLLGYTKRNSFLTGNSLAQISEFSLILVVLGVNAGHLPREIISLVTLVGLVTIAGSTYMILYSGKMYAFLSRHLNIFERKGKKVDEHGYYTGKNYEVLLFGYNRIGFDLIKSFKKLKKRHLVVDFDPEVILNSAKEGIECKYGDATDSELLNQLNFKKAKMVVSTIPDFETNLLIVQRARKFNKKAIIIVISHQIEDALRLYKSGATYVLMPHFLGGHHAATMIEDYGFNTKKFFRERKHHLKHLTTRKAIGHEHPKAEKER